MQKNQNRKLKKVRLWERKKLVETGKKKEKNF